MYRSCCEWLRNACQRPASRASNHCVEGQDPPSVTFIHPQPPSHSLVPTPSAFLVVFRRADHVQGGHHAQQSLDPVPLLPDIFRRDLVSIHELRRHRLHRLFRHCLHRGHRLPMYSGLRLLGPNERRAMHQPRLVLAVVRRPQHHHRLRHPGHAAQSDRQAASAASGEVRIVDRLRARSVVSRLVPVLTHHHFHCNQIIQLTISPASASRASSAPQPSSYQPRTETRHVSPAPHIPP